MLIDRTHKPWLVASTLIVAGGVALYAVGTQSVHGMSGGSVLGLLFGIAGSLFMVIAALLAVRKRLPTWRVGSAQSWLRAHLWLGTVGFILVLFHAGFGWGGLVENLLWLSFGLVVLTGFAGLALQQVIPRLLTTQVPLETIIAQIPFLTKTMLFRADQLVASQTGPLDVPFDELTPFAAEVLKQQGVMKRESDLPKELAKAYLNVSQPEGEVKKGHAAEKPSPTAKPPAVVATKVVATASANAEQAPSTAAESPPPIAFGVVSTSVPSPVEPGASTETAPAVKPKSPLELMREKATAKAVAGSAGSPPASVSPSTDAPSNDPPKKLSPIEMMRAKKAAQENAAATTAPVQEAATNAVVATPPAIAADPISTTTSSDKPLSPVEIMRAKMSAAKGSSADKPADTPKPLTIDQTSSEKPQAAIVEKPSAPLVAKKPPPFSKPVAVSECAAPSVAAAKAKPVIIPPTQLDELRDFHLKIVRPFLDRGISPEHGLNESMTARRLFAQLKSDLPAELHETIRQLEAFCEERRQFAVQRRLHRWMHWWLILHIPPSIALLVLFVAHVVMSLRVVPFGR